MAHIGWPIAGKVFGHFFETPANVRKMIIDEMQADDRCRLTRCSKQCKKEANASKNYKCKLYFTCRSGQALISFKFENYGRSMGFSLDFHNNLDRKFKRCISQGRELWREDFDGSTNIYQLASDEFKTILHSNQSTVKILDIDTPDYDCKNIDENIESFDNLEDLDVCGQVDILRILSKTRKPLENLTIDMKGENIDLAKCEKIYQVRQEFTWWNGKLDYQQFLRLSAKEITLGIGEITERDVLKFIKSWQDGTIGREIDSVEFFLKKSNFDKQKLLRLLRINNYEDGISEIKHYIKLGKTAELYLRNNFLVFST